MEPEHVEVVTKLGKLRGSKKKSDGIAQSTYYSFQGIPYAKPPVGNLRFKAPEPVDKWEGVRDATKEGNDSLQTHMLFKIQTGDEDCLYLNVYSSQLGEAAKKPVMVWLHGGGFAGGSGSSEMYGPDYIIEQDVVLVTVNYRCGVLGFLSLENEKVPGNFGLKDQALSLRWAQQNISTFGGDPNNVTIFGESAGAASVNYHLLSPLSRGLFHKAILQSGFSVCQWAYEKQPLEKALRIAKLLGCTSDNRDEVFKFLMSAPAVDIMKTQYNETLQTNKEKVQKFSLMFLPCVETAGDAPFLPDSPEILMQRGEFAKVPLIIGVNDKEGLLLIGIKDVHLERINGDLSVLVPLDMKTKRGSEEALGREILKFYTNQDNLSWDNMNGYVDFVSDVGFCIGFSKSRQWFLSHMDSTTPVYSYQFSYTTPRAISSFMMSMSYPEHAKEFVGTGACHADELIHLFRGHSTKIPFIPPTNEDLLFMKKFLKAWTNFAKSGNPNSDDLGVTWRPDQIKTPHYMDIGTKWKDVDGIPFPKRMEFWENLYSKHTSS